MRLNVIAMQTLGYFTIAIMFFHDLNDYANCFSANFEAEECG